MSYDVTIGGESFNYTYNLAELFHDFIDRDDKTGLQSLDGATGAQATRALKDAFRNMSSAIGSNGPEKFCQAYDAENGWGSTVGAMAFLAELMAACYENGRSRVRVH